jgi:gluconate kinase
MANPVLNGWTPVHIAWSSGEPVVEWRDLRGIEFVDPLFEHALERALHEPYRLMFAARTGISQLERVAQSGESPLPSGFILHASRCGSTLISSMLAVLEEAVVLSEPPAIDGVLRADLFGSVDDATREQWLGWTLAALGQSRSASHQRLFVKLDAWSTRDLPLLRASFPDVPCMFVYRDPIEILESHMRVRGAHMVPGLLQPQLFGLDLTEPPPLTGDEYCARVVAAILQSALEHLGDSCLLVNYAELPAAVERRVLSHLGIQATAAELERMRTVSLLDAKNPVLPFDPHARNRQWPPTPSLRVACERFAAEPYARLEEMRVAQREERR